MTNRIALALALLITLLALADGVLSGGTALLFLARRLADLVQSLAVWR